MKTMQQTDKSDYRLLRIWPRFTWKVYKPLDKLVLSSELVTSKEVLDFSGLSDHDSRWRIR